MGAEVFFKPLLSLCWLETELSSMFGGRPSLKMHAVIERRCALL